MHDIVLKPFSLPPPIFYSLRFSLSDADSLSSSNIYISNDEPDSLKDYNANFIYSAPGQTYKYYNPSAGATGDAGGYQTTRCRWLRHRTVFGRFLLCLSVGLIMVALGMCCLSSLTGHSNEHEVYRGLSRWTMYDLVSYFDCTQMHTKNNSAVLITRTFARAHIYAFASTNAHAHTHTYSKRNLKFLKPMFTVLARVKNTLFWVLRLLYQ